MDNKDFSEVLRRIIEKELSKFSKLLPKDVISNIEKRISPELENIIEQSGYIKKSKYNNLEKIIDDLEKRISDLEND